MTGFCPFNFARVFSLASLCMWVRCIFKESAVYRSQGIKVCLSPGILFSLQKGEHVGPIAAVVWIPSSFFAPYLLIAIYKEDKGKGGVSSPSLLSLFYLCSCGVTVGRVHPSLPLRIHIYSLFEMLFMFPSLGMGKRIIILTKRWIRFSFFVFVVLVKLYHVLQWSLHNGAIRRRWFWVAL